MTIYWDSGCIVPAFLTSELDRGEWLATLIPAPARNRTLGHPFCSLVTTLTDLVQFWCVCACAYVCVCVCICEYNLPIKTIETVKMITPGMKFWVTGLPIIRTQVDNAVITTVACWGLWHYDAIHCCIATGTILRQFFTWKLLLLFLQILWSTLKWGYWLQYMFLIPDVDMYQFLITKRI